MSIEYQRAWKRCPGQARLSCRAAFVIFRSDLPTTQGQARLSCRAAFVIFRSDLPTTQGAMSRRNGPTAAQPASSKVKYSKLPDSDDGYIDLQFKRPPPRVPYRAIALAAALFLIGSLLIIIGSLLLTGYIDTKYADRTWPVLTVGVLVFLPGVYHLRIAILAYRGTAGYSYDDIPDFSD
ncbi:transmembrane protein 230 isoform X8 [Petromyzon marinus]|uniref:transmembrane protein 230 isoform X8 n=1 Tax=Petromyzon marinus TaxID=7757 RepID=UPI003F6F2127